VRVHGGVASAGAERYNIEVRLSPIAVAGLLFVVVAARPAQAQPEARGPEPVTDYDAGRVRSAGADIPMRVYLPASPGGPAPVVLVVHGFLRNGTYMAELARTLASRGMVALVPDMPCGLGGCDHAANAAQLAGLLEWAVLEGGRRSSTLAGRVDGARRGAVGHSWGALSSLLASARPGALEVVVLLDPNDDRGEGAQAATRVAAPLLLLTAEVLGTCNSAWGGGVFATVPAPSLRARILGAAHCDAEEPSDALCPIGCGRGDPTKSTLFRRYAVAFVACALQGDRAMAPWVDGAAMAMDTADGALDQVLGQGLDRLACRAPATSEDGGVARDSGAASPADDADLPSARDASDGPAVPEDAASDAGAPEDAEAPRADATSARDATSTLQTAPASCASAPSGGLWASLVVLLVLVLRGRPSGIL
jgi:dienelactone hydrolase